MDSEPRAEGALEACAREFAAIRFHFTADDALAIMRRHGLREPGEIAQLEQQLAEARAATQRIRDSLSGKLPSPSWRNLP